VREFVRYVADERQASPHTLDAYERHLAMATVRRSMYALGRFFGWAVPIAAADRLAQSSQRKLDAQAPALVWLDVDLEHGELLVRYGKGRKSRRVPLEDADFIALLSRSRARRRSAAGGDVGADADALARPVFVGTGGKGLSRTSFYRHFHRVLAAAELSGLGHHAACAAAHVRLGAVRSWRAGALRQGSARTRGRRLDHDLRALDADGAA